MSVILRIKKGLKNFLYDPEYKIGKFAVKHFRPELIPDRIFLKYQFHYVFGYKLDLKHPKTFNEKLQWLKLYDRNPLYTTLVDKLAVKKWVAETIGDQYVIPTLAVYDSVNEIDLDSLPDQFVLKCTHDSGSVCICSDKNSFDFESAKHTLKKGLNSSFYLKHREWPYKNVTARIIAESFIEDSDKRGSLTDYKFFCFNGIPKLMYVSTDGAEFPTTDFFDMDYNILPIRLKDPNSVIPPSKPEQFEEMKNLAMILSAGIPFVRVDFYCNKGNVLFGEMTFFHNAGLTPFSPKEWNIKVGEWIQLPKSHNFISK